MKSVEEIASIAREPDSATRLGKEAEALLDEIGPLLASSEHREALAKMITLYGTCCSMQGAAMMAERFRRGVL